MGMISIRNVGTILGTPGVEDIAATVSFTQWAGRRAYIRLDSEDVIFPTVITEQVTGAVTLDVADTDGSFCWRVQVRPNDPRANRSLTRYVTVTGDTDFEDLVDVDPATFAPASDATVIGTIRSELLDGLRLERVTQAEYDLIPIPRPVDVLYVITT